MFCPPWKVLVEETSNKIKENYGKILFQKPQNFVALFFQQCPLNEMRMATMELITKTHKLITSIKDGDSANQIQKILLNFDEWMDVTSDEAVKEAMSATVSQHTWDNCFKIVVYQKLSKKIAVLDLLFCIRSPESEKRKALINAGVRKLLDKEATFRNGIDWIKTFELNNLKEAQFDNIVYKSIIYGYEKLLKRTLEKFDEKLRCVRLIDQCLKRAETDILENQSQKDLVDFITIKKLPAFIGKISNSYGINAEKYKLYACRALFIEKTQLIYSSFDRYYFELYALEALKGRTVENKLDFLYVISDDLQYACCWAKYLKLSTKSMPPFLPNCEQFDADAELFIEKITKTPLTSEDEDCIVDRKFWGKSYKLITIATPEALNNFIDEYFIKSKPKIMGIDCEAGFPVNNNEKQKIAVLQLATSDWCCLIDIQLLSDKLSENQWRNIFEHFFHPDILRIGFMFQCDYYFLCSRFPNLQKFFEQKERKVLCLQKLTDSTINCDGIFKTKLHICCGLADLAKEILNIDLDKSLQNSDWSKRPLKTFQKLYAISDALIVVLIHEKMEPLLKEKLGETVAAEMFEKSYVCNKKYNS
uniref:3'-5' exonuclease domain-containing protein n=1 Tax=Panagrolaimus superbus TaxID=310955 RepID=A0A914YCF9_9BILA